MDARGKLLRKRDERRLPLRLTAQHDCAAGDGGGALGRGDYRGGGRCGGPLLFSDGGGVNVSVGSHSQRGDFTPGSLIENKAFHRGGTLVFLELPAASGGKGGEEGARLQGPREV